MKVIATTAMLISMYLIGDARAMSTCSAVYAGDASCVGDDSSAWYKTKYNWANSGGSVALQDVFAKTFKIGVEKYGFDRFSSAASSDAYEKEFSVLQLWAGANRGIHEGKIEKLSNIYSKNGEDDLSVNYTSIYYNIPLKFDLPARTDVYVDNSDAAFIVLRANLKHSLFDAQTKTVHYTYSLFLSSFVSDYYGVDTTKDYYRQRTRKKLNDVTGVANYADGTSIGLPDDIPSPIPVPAALPLFAGGIACLGLGMFRRRAERIAL